MMRYIYAFLICFFVCANLFAQAPIDSLLKELDITISQQKYYQEQREKKILDYKVLLTDSRISDEQRYLILSDLFNVYRSFQLDSALLYLDQKIELARTNEKWYIESMIQQSKLFSTTGMYMEAMTSRNSLDRSKIPNNLLDDYYLANAELYNQLAYYTRMPNASSYYLEQTTIYRDSLFMVLSPNSREGLKEKEMDLSRRHEYAKAREIALSIISEMKEDHPEYAYYAYRIASDYRDEGNNEKKKEYLIRSAISDIKNSTKDNASLSMLAMVLYNENQIQKAYKYIQFSLGDASFFNAPLRIVELSNVLPVINDAYLVHVERERLRFQYFLILIGFLVVTLSVLIVFIFMQNKKLNQMRCSLQEANGKLNTLNQDLSKANKRLNVMNGQLYEANNIKEQYVGLFLSRCSDYIEKIQKLSQTVSEMIAAHKYSDLYDLMKSTSLVGKELAEYYQAFDKSFLAMFPNFVEQVNALLQPDGQLVPKNGELLNTELRMFALIRLGITDSSRIANLLRYSVTTIYNYRTKVRNKSLGSRDAFENEIQKISTYISSEDEERDPNF